MKNYILYSLYISLLCTHVYSMDVPKILCKRLFDAIQLNNNDQIKMLLEAHPELVNCRHDYDDHSRILFGKVSPLHVAVYTDNVDAITLLLSKGADPNIKNLDHCSDEDITPLHCVRSKTAVQLLMRNGALVDAKDRCGRTPLYQALFRHSHYEIAGKLIEWGANVNQRVDDVSNDTLLHHAIRERGPVIDRVKLILSYAANRYARNASGKSPLDYAIRYHNGWQELIALLR